jgi:hypothetical protein
VPSATALDQADRPWNRPGVSLANSKFGITLQRTSPCGPDREARGGLRDRSLPVSDACIRSFLVDRRRWSRTRSQSCCAMRPCGGWCGKAAAVVKYSADRRCLNSHAGARRYLEKRRVPARESVSIAAADSACVKGAALSGLRRRASRWQGSLSEHRLIFRRSYP